MEVAGSRGARPAENGRDQESTLASTGRLEMEAGRELNALVAEHVMGWRWLSLEPEFPEQKALYPPDLEVDQVSWCVGDDPKELAEDYSTDIRAAMNVVEKLNRLWFEIGRENAGGVRWDAIFYNDPDLKDSVHVTADTAPLAICLAALMTVGYTIDDE